jgi:integrase
MRGHIRKRGSTYSIVVDIGRDENGKRKQKWFSGYKTKKEAEKALANIIDKIEKNQYFDVENISLKDYLFYWLKNYAKKNVAESTYKRYEEFSNRIIAFLGNIDLNKLKPIHLQTFYSKLSEEEHLSNSTILKIHRMLHLALKHAVGWQMMYNNPSDAVTPPRAKKIDIKVWDSDTSNKFLEFIKNEKIYLPVLLALHTGMREGEISALKWENVDLEKGYIYVVANMQYLKGKLTLKEPKTKKSIRNIALMDSTIKALEKYKKEQLQNKLLLGSEYKDNDFVCTHENGEPLNPQYISKRFLIYEKAYKKIQEENNETPIEIIRFHDLRHTHATLLLKAGVNPKIVSERLGHASVSITLDIYSHVLPNIQKEAIGKLNDVF